MRFIGFLLGGLRDPLTPTGANAKKPVLFTNHGVNVAQLPAEFAGYTISPILPPGKDIGENVTGDPRGGLPTGGEQAIDLPEDDAGNLGKVLQQNPKAHFWFLTEPVLAAEAASPIDISVYGRPGVTYAPSVGSVYWIEAEAFYCTAVFQTSILSPGITWSVTLERAVCGSYLDRHEVDPACYGEGNPGKEDRLQLDASPNWEAHRFKAMIVCWHLPGGRSGPAVELDRDYFFVDDPPEMIQEGLNYFYRIKPRAISDVIRAHRFGFGGKDVPMDIRLQVIQLEQETTSSGYFARPKKARAAMSRLRAEQLFRHALHKPLQSAAKLVYVDDLAARIAACLPEVETRIVVKASGTWVFKVTDVDLESLAGALVNVYLDLVAYDRTATIASAPPPGAPQPGQPAVTPASFEAGWSWGLTNTQPGEEAPLLSLRWAFHCSPIKAAQIILHSRCGASGGPFDKMIGFQLALPDTWINDGAAVAAGTELTIDPRTKELLQLNQLLNETITPSFEGTDTAGAFFQDLCLLYLLMFTRLSTGKVTLRRWATTAPTSLQTLRPLKASLDTGTPLDPLRAIRLMSGIHQLDLTPEFARTVTLGGTKTIENLPNALPLRVWKPGNVISEDALKSEAFSNFFRALFSVLGGAPRAFAVETSLEVQVFDPGDVALWSDKKIPTPEGRGFSGVSFFVVTKDVNRREGVATYKVLRDYYNDTTTTTGRVAPALEITQVLRRQNGPPYLVDLEVKSIGEPVGWDLNGGDLDIWTTLRDDEARVRIYYPREHNPDAEDERPGWLECSAQVIAVNLSGYPNRLQLAIDTSWTRGGFTVLYDLIQRGAKIVLSDYRSDETNPEAALIEPHPQQLYLDGAGLDFAKWGATKTFDRGYTLISDVP